MKHSLLLALSATAALLSACTKDKEVPTPSTPPAPPTTPAIVNPGYVRLVNNLATRPGGNVQQGPVQMELSGRPLGPAAAVGTATPYQALSAGEPSVWIALPATSGMAWVQINRLPIVKDRRYSLFTYSSGAQQSARVVEEAALPAPVAGKAHLRVLNVAAEWAPVRIEESATATLYPEVAWNSITSYQAVEARTYALHASRTDGIQNQLFTQAVTLAPGKAYTLVLRGSNYPDAVAPERIAFDVVIDE